MIKYILALVLMLGLTLGSMAKPLPVKPSFSTITYSYLIATDHVENISYTVGVDVPNDVDYRVVVGVWSYFKQWVPVAPGSPLKTFRWEWGYRYYSLILPANVQAISTYWNQWTYNWQIGEDVDPYNYYVSFYGPN